MLELFNAKERDLDDWAKLFERADARFKFVGSKQPKKPRSYVSSKRVG